MRIFALAALALLAAAFAAAGCNGAGDSSPGTPTPPRMAGEGTPAAVATATVPAPATAHASATRAAYTGVGADWPGRDQYLVCVEDRSGQIGDAAIRDRVEAAIANRVSLFNPGLPVRVEAGCPFDYPQGEIITRDSPGRYAVQLYVSPAVQQPAGRAAEQWFRGNADSATPVTFLVEWPVSVLQDPAKLQAAVEMHFGPEPTQLRRP